MGGIGSGGCRVGAGRKPSAGPAFAHSCARVGCSTVFVAAASQRYCSRHRNRRCAICRRTFLPPKSTSRFCKRHRRNWRRPRSSAEWRWFLPRRAGAGGIRRGSGSLKVPVLKVCEICQSEFLARKSCTRFCPRHSRSGWGEFRGAVDQDPSLRPIVAALLGLRDEVKSGVYR
jgi:hypothetical protein